MRRNGFRGRLSMGVTIRPLTLGEWPDLVSLFSQGGDARWCWCTYWRDRAAAFDRRPASINRARLEAVVASGASPGLVAYENGRAVGWVSLGPRTDFERLERSRVLARIDDAPVWSIVCFAVSRPRRGRGVATALLAAAVEYAREHGAAMLETYPVAAGTGRLPSAAAFTGTLPMFESAGFTVASMTRSVSSGYPRAIVRLDLRPGPAGTSEVNASERNLASD